MGFSKDFEAILSKSSSPTWQKNHHDTIAGILEGFSLVSAMIGCIFNQWYSQHKTAIPIAWHQQSIPCAYHSWHLNTGITTNRMLWKWELAPNTNQLKEIEVWFMIAILFAILVCGSNHFFEVLRLSYVNVSMQHRVCIIIKSRGVGSSAAHAHAVTYVPELSFFHSFIFSFSADIHWCNKPFGDWGVKGAIGEPNMILSFMEQ